MVAPFPWREFIQYLEREAFLAEFIPFGLKRGVRMFPHLQLEFMPVENAGKIDRGAYEHFLVGDIADLIDAHRTMIQLILSFQLGLFITHMYSEVVMEPMEEGVEYSIPTINISPLISGRKSRHAVAGDIGQACRECGFFYITGHVVEEGLQRRLEDLSRRFFAQDVETKMEIRMARGGRAWRGYFPVGGELTSGQPDMKEGIYFGAELGDDHPMTQSGVPMHGPNLFPSNIPGFRETVLEYIAVMTELGHALTRGIALSLGLDESYFDEHYTGDPLTLFRIFNYPAQSAGTGWGVGEHTDYGLLTILKQDEIAIALDRSASGSRIVRMQHRRYAGSIDRWAVSFDAASRA
jgi:hypothetical protein